jgi:hypothetical protein
VNDELPLKDHKKTNFGVKKIRLVWRVLGWVVGENKKRKIYQLPSRHKYLYVPLQIVDVCSIQNENDYRFYSPLLVHFLIENR